MSLLSALKLPAPGAARPAAQAATSGDSEQASPAGVSGEHGEGDFSVGLKASADGAFLTAKWEHKKYIAGQNFKVWIVPCYVSATVGVSVDGEIGLVDAGKRKLKVCGSGSGNLGILGYTSEEFTVGPRGNFTLSAETAVPVTVDQARSFAADPFVVEILGKGKVGFSIEIKDGPSRAYDIDVADWQLYIVHVGACISGRFGSVRVEEGKDMKRLIAALSQFGTQVADAVEKYAPKAVKEAAEAGAKWAAESKTAQKVAEQTQKVVDSFRKETGVDLGGAVEKAVRVLCDPGGETSSEATTRVERELVAFNASYDDYKSVMKASGLDDDLKPPYRTSAEYNAIVDVWAKEAEVVAKGGTAKGAWRPMVEALVAKARKNKAETEARKASEAKAKKDQADADAAAALARRVAEAEARMNTAEQAANNFGNPLNNRTVNTPEAKARQYWKQGMRFRDPATVKKQTLKSLAGEARIAMADEATALFLKARTVFEQGAGVRD